MGFLIPAALGLGAVGSFLNGRSQSNQSQDQAKLYNDWQRLYQQTGQGLYGQAQAGGWNPFGPQVSTSQNNGMSSSFGNTSFNNRPVITDEYKPFDAMMRQIMGGRLSGGSSLPAGYASNAARAINESFEGADAAARNMAARKGLSGEQSYAVASPANRARAGQLADMRGSLPLLERQMQNEDIGIMQGLQSAFGVGQQGSSRTSQQGTTSNMGTHTNPFSASELNALMQVLMPPGPQQTMQSGVSPVGSGISSIGSLLGYLASQQGATYGQPKFNHGGLTSDWGDI